jgi:EAL domain-containing protein (putative c-di-GMP-specific phosphodiesterase class I)
MHDTGHILFIGSDIDEKRLRKQLGKYPNPVALHSIADAADLPVQLQNPGKWDLIICKSGQYLDQGINQKLNDVSRALDASVILLKTRNSKMQPHEAYEVGAQDIIIQTDTEHFLMVIDRELRNAGFRKTLRKTLRKSLNRETMDTVSEHVSLPFITDYSQAGQKQKKDYDAMLQAAVTDQPQQAEHQSSINEEDIIRQITDCSMVLQYQPIIKLKDGTDNPTMFEVLVRLLDDDNNLVYPGAFMSVARKHGLMKNIDKQVFRESLSTMKNLQSMDSREVNLFINLSGYTLSDREAMNDIFNILESRKINNGSLVVELRKRTLLEDNDNVLELYERLSENNHRLLLEAFDLDDCMNIKLFADYFDFIKLNAPLLNQVNNDGHKQRALTDLLHYATDHGMKVIAHAIERADSLPYLYSLGVDFIQGYFVSMPYEDLIYPDIHKIDISDAYQSWTDK